MQNAPTAGDIRLVISRKANGKIRKVDGDQFTVQFNAPEYDGDEVTVPGSDLGAALLGEDTFGGVDTLGAES